MDAALRAIACLTAEVMNLDGGLDVLIRFGFVVRAADGSLWQAYPLEG